MSPRSLPAFSLCSAFALVIATAGCGSDDGISSITENLTDSFAKPTLHGELMFGIVNQAEFTQTQRFHAWEFELSGDATVDLRTDLFETNLDSVMYLYRREPGASSWGAYTAKNDDTDGQLWSHIGGDFGAGEYLIKVKATKAAMRGAFAVLGTCDGAGCPVQDEAVCEAGVETPLPAQTGFAPSCAGDMTSILLAPVESAISVAVELGDKCEAGASGAKGVDFYRQYWDELIGWEDFTGGEENRSLNVRVVRHGAAGTTVEVDAGGDEDLLAFVFDGTGRLVMYYHSEQSPVAGWFCAEDGEVSVEPPVDDCAGATVWALRHEGSPTPSEGQTSAAGAGLSPLMRPVASRFAEVNGLGASDAISFATREWESIDGNQAGELTLSAGGASTTYLVSDRFGSGTSLLLETDSSGALAFVCEEL